MLAALTASLAVAHPARPPLRAQLRLAAAPPPAGFEWGAFDRAGLLEKLDTQVVSRAVRLANHVPASASLAYFGLISTTMMSMPMPMMVGGVATLRSVITRGVGPTTNEAFAALFPTLVTPANFVFLIWPAISLLQLLTLASSALPLPGRTPLKQDSLTALAAANCAATAWLLFASNAAAGALPLASSLTLPLVPLLAGFPLRSAGPPLGLQRLAFSVYAAFTTLASFLALAVELQHGGRLPLVGTLPAEAAACVFVSLAAAAVAPKQRTVAVKAVNLLALTGILARRLGAHGLSTVPSVSFVATVACWAWAAKKLVAGE